jgi:hypothetical protein
MKLTRPEEKALFLAYRAGDASAGEKLASCFMQWALTEAVRKARSTDDADLNSAALFGLARALKSYDPDFGGSKQTMSFAAYARRFIGWEMNKAIIRRSRLRDPLVFCGLLPETSEGGRELATHRFYEPEEGNGMDTFQLLQQLQSHDWLATMLVVGVVYERKTFKQLAGELTISRDDCDPEEIPAGWQGELTVPKVRAIYQKTLKWLKEKA